MDSNQIPVAAGRELEWDAAKIDALRQPAGPSGTIAPTFVKACRSAPRVVDPRRVRLRRMGTPDVVDEPEPGSCL